MFTNLSRIIYDPRPHNLEEVSACRFENSLVVVYHDNQNKIAFRILN